MRNWLKSIIGVLSAVVLAGAFTSSVYGVASFARQTGLDCYSCHSAHGYPSLNTFGAAFKAGGYTSANDEYLIGDGEGLSLPQSMNLSFAAKLRAVKNSGSIAKALGGGTYDTAEVQFPDELAIFLAGKIANNIGFVTEYAEGEALSFKITHVYDVGPAKLGIVPWWSDAFGAPWVFETLSTGAVRNIRVIEDRKAQSAQNFLGWGQTTTAQHGLGAYVWHPMGFVAYTPYAGDFHGGVDAKYANYVRAAATPSVAGWDLGIGVQYFTGDWSAPGSGALMVYENQDFMAVDFQAMGNVGLPLGVFVTYGTYDHGVAGVKDTASVYTLTVDAGLIENKLNVALGYRGGNKNQGTEVDVSAVVACVKYHLANNYRLQLDITQQLGDVEKGGSDDLQIMPMIFGSF